METKFTKGNWFIKESKIEKTDITCQTVIMTDLKYNDLRSPVICDMWGMATEEGLANAKLIIAAKEMFYRTVLLANSEGWQDAFDLICKITGVQYTYLSDEFNALVEEAKYFFKH